MCGERQETGLVSVSSPLTFAETIRNLLIAIERRGMILFARIDHAKAARKTGIKLMPAEFFIFGYPEAEAPLLAINSLFSLDCPQRLLVWENEDGRVSLSYNDPVWLGLRHGASPDACRKLDAIRASLAGIALEASGPKPGSAGA